MSVIQHTPGPWEWFVRFDGVIYLGTPDKGHLIVMDFARKGMRAAQPRFAVWDGMAAGKPRERLGGILQDGLVVDGATHPDAKLIAAAPDLFAALNRLFQLCDPTISGAWNSALEQARAAIAKATS